MRRHASPRVRLLALLLTVALAPLIVQIGHWHAGRLPESPAPAGVHAQSHAGGTRAGTCSVNAPCADAGHHSGVAGFLPSEGTSILAAFAAAGGLLGLLLRLLPQAAPSAHPRPPRRVFALAF